MENQQTEPKEQQKEGIDQWNDRLDENLEKEETNDTAADEKARSYSNENGSGDQSDEKAE